MSDEIVWQVWEPVDGEACGSRLEIEIDVGLSDWSSFKGKALADMNYRFADLLCAFAFEAGQEIGRLEREIEAGHVLNHARWEHICTYSDRIAQLEAELKESQIIANNAWRLADTEREKSASLEEKLRDREMELHQARQEWSEERSRGRDLECCLDARRSQCDARDEVARQSRKLGVAPYRVIQWALKEWARAFQDGRTKDERAEYIRHAAWASRGVELQ